MTASNFSRLDVVVLAHTHWDREWYHVAGRFRQRLVALVDELLSARFSDVPSFLLDGQAVVLDDYLEARPTRRDELSAALAAGRLEAGPWYVLADELIPSGEALVRNLLAGRRTLSRFGATAPAVLYCPDSFGHPAALPAIARGFGCDVAVVWRGYGGARWPDGDAAWWHAPNGGRVLLYHLPPDGYEFGSSLPTDAHAAAERWERMRAVLAPRARLGVVVVQNGADHHAPQPGVADALAALAHAARPEEVRALSLSALGALLATRAGSAELPAVAGELRDSYGYTWTLQGTFAARAAQKRRNAAVERALVRDCEPWVALTGPTDATAGRRDLLHAAWRTLLLCHPHDTLCGCSIDAVARAADARFDDAEAQVRGLREDALHDVAGHDPVTARTRRAEWRPALVVRNRAARPRAGVAEVELSTFLEDVPVGPGSAAASRGPTGRRGAPVSAGSLALQILDRRLRHDRIESPRHYPDDDLVEVARAVAWVPDVAGYGTASFALERRAAATSSPPPGIDPVSAGDGFVENGLLRLTVSARGEVGLASLRGETSIPGLLSFEDVGDAGDLYTHSPVGRLITSAWFLGVRTLHRGPLRGELEARWRLRLPAGRRRTDGGDRVPARGGRGAGHVETTMTVRFTLDAAARFLRVSVAGENRARDHRLRVRFTTPIAEAGVRADAAFGPVVRMPIEVPPEVASVEAPPPTAPLHRYVTVHGERFGVTLYSDGLAEYEASSDGSIAVTLIRAVGELSRNDIPERPGHAGWPAAVPEAQSLGPFAASFALMPHAPLDDRVADEIERAADDVLLPLVGDTLRSALVLPAATRGVELEGAGLAFSCAKPSEDGAWIVLRCVNLTGAEVAGRWRLARPLRDARLSRLDETPGEPLAREGDSVSFVAAPRDVVTILVR